MIVEKIKNKKKKLKYGFAFTFHKTKYNNAYAKQK